MKRILIILSIVMVMVLAFAACTAPKTDDEMDTMAKDTMDKGDMDTEDGHDTMDDDSMDDKDTMDDKDDSMDKDDENMENEEMMENFLDVTLMDVDGNEWNLSMLDQKAVVKVWASWCGICLSGMDEYDEFSAEYEDAKVLSVVTPDMFGEKEKDEFIEWFKGLEGADNVVVILDEEGVIVNNLGIRGFPTYVYLNSDGYVHSGAIGHQATADVIAKLEMIG